jgi:putative transposase
MPRPPRLDIGGNYYHILNRANARMQIFFNEEDYQMIEQILKEAVELFETKLLAYCIMPNHIHLVLATEHDGELAHLMKWITQTHTNRWHAKHNTVGTGHLYQGRYKSFIIQDEPHLFTVLRYVERNPLTAKLVKNPLNWKYSSLYKRHHGSSNKHTFLSLWSIEEPKDYVQYLTQAITPKEIEKLEQSEMKSLPYGDDQYILDTVEKYDLQAATRGRGRPKKL